MIYYLCFTLGDYQMIHYIIHSFICQMTLEDTQADTFNDFMSDNTLTDDT